MDLERFLKCVGFVGKSGVIRFGMQGVRMVSELIVHGQQVDDSESVFKNVLHLRYIDILSLQRCKTVTFP